MKPSEVADLFGDMFPCRHPFLSKGSRTFREPAFDTSHDAFAWADSQIKSGKGVTYRFMAWVAGRVLPPMDRDGASRREFPPLTAQLTFDLPRQDDLITITCFTRSWQDNAFKIKPLPHLRMTAGARKLVTKLPWKRLFILIKDGRVIGLEGDSTIEMHAPGVVMSAIPGMEISGESGHWYYRYGKPFPARYYDR